MTHREDYGKHSAVNWKDWLPQAPHSAFPEPWRSKPHGRFGGGARRVTRGVRKSIRGASNVYRAARAMDLIADFFPEEWTEGVSDATGPRGTLQPRDAAEHALPSAAEALLGGGSTAPRRKQPPQRRQPRGDGRERRPSRATGPPEVTGSLAWPAPFRHQTLLAC